MLAKKTVKNQITLPKSIVERLPKTDYFEEILPYAEVVKPKRRLRVVQRDPSDNKFLECAVAGKARVIISGDKELLSLGRYRQIPIQSPAQFLADNPELPDS